MERAVYLAAQSVTESDKKVASPNVGALAVDRDGHLIAEAFRGEHDDGDHAEWVLIKKARAEGLNLEGATLYTTLEPCTSRNPPKIPCADRLIEEGVAVVFVGMLDPDGRIRERGWKQLRDARVKVLDFDAELRGQLEELNRPFVERFQIARGLEGSITFDYEQNAGRMTIESSGGNFETKWSQRGKGSIYAVGTSGRIAASRYATTFDDIDDPDRFEFVGHSHDARVGQIVIFRSEIGHALVRIESVLAGADHGDPRTELVVSYEVRLRDT